jgi:hypothetical protein
MPAQTHFLWNEGFWRAPGEYDKNTNTDLTRLAGFCKYTAPTLH